MASATSPGFFVALHDTLRDLHHGIGAQVRDEPALAGQHFLDFAARVTPREAKVGEFARKAGCPPAPGAKGPSPSSALLTSTTRPCLCAATEMPPPRCATTRFAFS